MDRRGVLKTACILAGVLTSTPAITKPLPANAWCGRNFPAWAYSLSFNEGSFPYEVQATPEGGEKWSGEIFLRVLGDEKKEKKNSLCPLILIPGGPGLPHDYLETLEAAAFSDRRIILFDPIGTGESSKGLPANVASSEDLRPLSSFMAAQVKAIADFLQLGDHHVLGHGFGASPALEYASNVIGAHAVNASSPSISSLTLGSPFVVLGEQALANTYKDKQEPVPICVDTALRGADYTDFKLVSELEDKVRVESDMASSPFLRVAGSVPTFVTYGSRDLVSPDLIAKLAKNLEAGGGGRGQAVVTKEFLRSGHLPHVDEREEYVEFIMAQLDAVDARPRKNTKKFRG